MNRTMPNNLDAEKAVLGALLYDSAAASEAIEILQSDGSDFHYRAHQIIFKTIIVINNRGGVADLVTVADELRNQGALDKVGGVAYIAELTDGAFSTANIRHYAEIVKGKANERRIIEAGQSMIESVYSGQSEDAIAEAQKNVLALSMECGGKTLRTGFDIAKTTMNQIETRYKSGGGRITGTSTGLKDFDERPKTNYY